MVTVLTRARIGTVEIRRGMWALTAVWCGTILAGPLVQSDIIYYLFSTICHQHPERSWHLAGHTLPVCIRCASIYFGFFIALSFRLRAHAGFLRFALGAMAVEFVVARLWIDWEPTRALSGLLLGLAAAGFVQTGVIELLDGMRPRQRARIDGGTQRLGSVS